MGADAFVLGLLGFVLGCALGEKTIGAAFFNANVVGTVIALVGVFCDCSRWPSEEHSAGGADARRYCKYSCGLCGALVVLHSLALCTAYSWVVLEDFEFEKIEWLDRSKPRAAKVQPGDLPDR